jgi:cytochrome c-type biogenesis protein CcmH
MTAFWLAGAALAAVAVLVILRPLLWRRGGERVSRSDANVSIYRDQLRELDADLAAGTLAQADYERARREIEARLLEDVPVPAAGAEPAPARGRAFVAAIAVAVPVAALGTYLLVGSPGALSLQVEHQATARQLDAMVERLAARLRESPDDVEGWKLLGRSYSALGRFPEAVDAYVKAATRAPRDAQILADLADVLAMVHGQRLQGEPEKLVLRALELDPRNLKALALAGTAAFERKDFAGAVRYWERMLPLVAPGSEDARSIQASIAEAQSFLKPGTVPATATLKGTVRLAPDLKAKASPDDTVFIFARAAQGPPMPLAVKRAKVRELPLEFALDDSMAMAPGMQLSGFARVVVGARVSKSGSATPQAGDLQGASAPVANDAQGVSVVIDTVVR